MAARLEQSPSDDAARMELGIALLKCGLYEGYLDLVLGNGSPRMDRLEPPILLEYDGMRFRNTTFAAGLPFYGKGHGACLADLFG